MISEKVQFWKVTDAKTIYAMVSCFVILVCNLVVDFLSGKQLCSPSFSISALKLQMTKVLCAKSVASLGARKR